MTTSCTAGCRVQFPQEFRHRHEDDNGCGRCRPDAGGCRALTVEYAPSTTSTFLSFRLISTRRSWLHHKHVWQRRGSARAMYIWPSLQSWKAERATPFEHPHPQYARDNRPPSLCVWASSSTTPSASHMRYAQPSSAHLLDSRRRPFIQYSMHVHLPEPPPRHPQQPIRLRFPDVTTVQSMLPTTPDILKTHSLIKEQLFCGTMSARCLTRTLERPLLHLNPERPLSHLNPGALTVAAVTLAVATCCGHCHT